MLLQHQADGPGLGDFGSPPLQRVSVDNFQRNYVKLFSCSALGASQDGSLIVQSRLQHHTDAPEWVWPWIRPLQKVSFDIVC